MIGGIKLTKICKVASKCLTVTIHQHYFPSSSQTPLIVQERTVVDFILFNCML